MEALIPTALAAGALVQIVKEAGWTDRPWLLRTIAVTAGGLMGFLAAADVVGGMASGGMATVVFAAAKAKVKGKLQGDA